MTATLSYRYEHMDTPAFDVKADGVENLDHAISVGQGLVGGLSLSNKAALFLSSVSIDAKNFACMATPSSMRENVNLRFV
jgi:hypothetical protein